MAKTLLNGVNEVLKRTGFITGDAGELSTLTDSARQVAIDQAVQVINEGVSELYTVSGKVLPKEQGSSTVTLLLATRDYTLATDLVQMRWPLVDRTNSQRIEQFPGDYNDMLLLDLEQDDTGLPMYGTIRPTDGKLFLDRAPTSAEVGRVYTYQYDKDLAMTTAAATMPFSDAVFRSMVPAWVQLWKREMRNEFDGDLFVKNIGTASRLLTQNQPRTSYNPRA